MTTHMIQKLVGNEVTTEKLARDIHKATDGWGTNEKLLEQTVTTIGKNGLFTAVNEKLGKNLETIIKSEIGLNADANRLIDILRTGEDGFHYSGFQKFGAGLVHSLDVTEIDFWKKLGIGMAVGIGVSAAAAGLFVAGAAAAGVALSFGTGMVIAGGLLLAGTILYEGGHLVYDVYQGTTAKSTKEEMHYFESAGATTGNLALLLAIPAGVKGIQVLRKSPVPKQPVIESTATTQPKMVETPVVAETAAPSVVAETAAPVEPSPVTVSPDAVSPVTGENPVIAVTEATAEPITTRPGRVTLAQEKAQRAKEIQQLISQLRTPSYMQEAAQKLGAMGPEAKQAISALMGILTETRVSDVDRNVVASALGKIGPEAIPSLINLLESSSYEILPTSRIGAAQALGYMGSKARKAIPQLKTALENSDPHVREAAASALEKIGLDSLEALPELTKSLKDPNAYVRQAAAQAIGKIGPEAKTAIPDLITTLKDSELEVRKAAMEAIGEMGSKATEAIPALIDMFNQSRSNKEAIDIAITLTKIGPESVVPALIEALQATTGFPQQCVIYTLSRIGPQAKEAIPALINTLAITDTRIQGVTVLALGQIGPEAVLPLREALNNNPSDYFRLGVVRALGMIASKNKTETPTVVELLQKTATSDASPHVRAEASEMIREIGGVSR